MEHFCQDSAYLHCNTHTLLKVAEVLYEMGDGTLISCLQMFVLKLSHYDLYMGSCYTVTLAHEQVNTE